MVGYAREHTFADALIKVIHVTTTEGWLEREHLVDNAAKGPYVRLVTVGLILPYLRAGVVWRACLCVVQTILVGDLAYIHVA